MVDKHQSLNTMPIHCIDKCGFNMEKDVQFAFRVESSLRQQFVRTCKGMDRPAGQVLREFMREFVRDHIQPSLFKDSIHQQQLLIEDLREEQ